MEQSILSLLIFIPVVGAILMLPVSKYLGKENIKWTALITTLIQLLLTVWLYINFDSIFSLLLISQQSFIGFELILKAYSQSSSHSFKFFDPAIQKIRFGLNSTKKCSIKSFEVTSRQINCGCSLSLKKVPITFNELFLENV